MRRKNLALTLACTLGLLVGTAKSRGQKSETTEPTAHSTAHDNAVVSDQELDLMRKDFRSKKKQVRTANMQLTDTEAEKFWPLYDEYTAETIKLNDRKYGLINYADEYGHMTDQQAEEYVQGLIGLDRSASDLSSQIPLIEP